MNEKNGLGRCGAACSGAQKRSGDYDNDNDEDDNDDSYTFRRTEKRSLILNAVRRKKKTLRSCANFFEDLVFPFL